ncbi:LEAF RUST 10 DISEASE-RESISTANCE LOCUS RECEPTOR-LIKE PROTEIN KINASE-like 2.8 [Dichanthelium oligosanthes]|uniref:LEAF RUST 10 DISEASE-RESISTANCE LOCUS RECEPTOR-LIKE PROTEIN KINASE-like 2.8 n=1 Tax=Dichanthelium oligosanthes TaxID=888268 RepID=A0A1E5WBN6_9POAL|nr:LEAF RUST 10 DISEASE-RESISTANCE LOCUS RECEPTOR-LIKE PROTEIN KINASE-like 2.8 [Dichanthelium oligosanthes]
MAAHARRLLLLCTLAPFLVALLHAATAAAATTSCAPRTCGNLTIAYPFWLPDQPSSNSSSPAPCGPAAFQVDCRGGRTSLARSFRGAYKILRVSYADRTVVVANDNVQTDAAGCPVPRIDVSASLSLAPFTASAANAQLVFLFNCTSAGGNGAPPPPGFVNVTCPDTQAVVRLDPKYNTSDARAVAGACDYSVVPVVGSPGASAGDYPQLLRGGYLLEWRASPGDCAACNASGGRCGYDSDADVFACICNDGSSRPARCDAKKSGKKVILIVSLSITLGLLLAFLIIIIKFCRRFDSFSLLPNIMDRRSSSDTANVEKLLQKYGALAPKRYRYSELKKITDSFKHKLGEGGYGAVFSGVLSAGAGGSPAREVAVKVLHHSRPNGEEFLNEVISIGRTSHVNIVTLLGFCLEGSNRALVYEYMPNGSLDRYIYAEDPGTALGWEALHEIAAGIARGLEYLHEGCNTRIIHFDIKPQNVLLDADFRPKIADFGMAKLCNPKESILSMADARGTIGFIAPEVFSRGFGVISAKSDVYSYGMLLLEMVGGRSKFRGAYAEKSSGDGESFFPLWVYDHLLEDGGVLQDRGAGAGPEAPGEEVARKMALIGLWCIQTVPASRPSMSGVLDMLEKSIHELAMPPRPYHTSPSNSPSPSRPSSYPSSASDFTLRSSRMRTPDSTA